MSMQKTDIWKEWLQPMALVVKDGSPVIGGFIHVYAQEDDAAHSACGCGHHHDAHNDCSCHDHGADGCGGSHSHRHGAEGGGDYAVQKDALVNMLYYAVFRGKAGVKAFGLEGGDIELSADELAEMAPAIDQLSTVFGYKTGQIGLDEFAREFKDQTVYYSTLVGETGDGRPGFFACTSGEDAVQYYPVFLTEAHLREFMDSHRRPAYTILQNSLARFLSLLDANEYTKMLGAVIEPMYSFSVSFPPCFRVEV